MSKKVCFFLRLDKSSRGSHPYKYYSDERGNTEKSRVIKVSPNSTLLWSYGFNFIFSKRTRFFLFPYIQNSKAKPIYTFKKMLNPFFYKRYKSYWLFNFKLDQHVPIPRYLEYWFGNGEGTLIGLLGNGLVKKLSIRKANNQWTPSCPWHELQTVHVYGSNVEI